MARVKGRDVLLELMDAVAKLEASSERHATQMESMAKISMETTAIVTALSGEVRMLWREVGVISKSVASLSSTVDALSSNVDALSSNVDALSSNVGSLSSSVGAIAQRVESLETETQRLSEGFLDAAQGARTNQQNLGQVARLLVEFSGNHTDRFDRIESRLDKLERKAG